MVNTDIWFTLSGEVFLEALQEAARTGNPEKIYRDTCDTALHTDPTYEEN